MVPERNDITIRYIVGANKQYSVFSLSPLTLEPFALTPKERSTTKAAKITKTGVPFLPYVQLWMISNLAKWSLNAKSYDGDLGQVGDLMSLGNFQSYFSG